jgi:DNA helicase-2/ATP-dependent DNA helicase PcrA
VKAATASPRRGVEGVGTLYVLGLENIRHIHEREAAIRLLRMLADRPTLHDAFLTFSVHVGAEIDCLLLTPSGATIGEFKEWPYRVVGRMNGPWLKQRGAEGMEIMPADASPYRQAQKQRSRLARLLETEAVRLRAHAPDNWSRYVNAGLVQCPRLRLEFEALNSPWWFQAGLEEFGQRLLRALNAPGQIDTRFYEGVLRKLGIASGTALPTIHHVLTALSPTAQPDPLPPLTPAKHQDPASTALSDQRHKLVLAGAGAGKTQRMATLIVAALRSDPNTSAYAISYTNRARDVLKERVLSLLNDELAQARIRFGTIHQFAQSLSRPLVGAKIVATMAGCLEFLSRALPGRPVDESTLQQISSAVYSSDGRTIPWRESWHAEAWKSLLAHLASKGETTFAGMLIDGLAACSQPNLPFTSLFVDEFQDTNRLQYTMLQRLAERGVSLTVVGDAEQSIYGFAGAMPRALESFESHFRPQKETLDFNHRSASAIVALSDRLRADGRNQSASRSLDGIVRLQRHASLRAAAVAVAIEIAERLDNEVSTNRSSCDFAILARTNAELAAFDAELKARGVPVQSRDNQPFHETRQIPKLLALLYALDQPDDPELLARALRAIGRTEAASELLATVERAATGAKVGDATFKSLSTQAAAATDALVCKLDAIRSQGISAAAQVAQLHQQFVVPTLGMFDRAPARLELLQSDADVVAKFAEYAAVSPAALARMIETEQAIAIAGTEGVRLATVHEAKGDQWPCVYLANVGASSFPHPASVDFAEEQRLFYVACTRAADELTLCHSDGKPISGFVLNAVDSVCVGFA